MSPRSSPRQKDFLAMEKRHYWDDIDPNPPAASLPVTMRIFNAILDVLRPVILTKTPPNSRPVPLRRTAYLDGIRGFAALLVYWLHHQLWSRDSINIEKILQNGYGWNGKYYFACLPVVRTFFTGGHYAVCTFFVISGYVLSTKPLSLIHSGELLKLQENVASALFRRWLRLNIPLIVVTFLYMCSWHAFGIFTVETVHMSNFHDEIWRWWYEIKNFTFVFRGGGEPWFTYSFHAWSIPMEFRGSLVIYTCVMAFSRLTRNARLLCHCVLIWYFMWIVDGWFCSLFVAGMLLADIDLLAANDDLPKFFNVFKPHKQIILYVMLAISLHFGGVPSATWEVEFLRKSPGWYYLSFLVPQAAFDYKWFFLLWASSFLVFVTPRIPWLKHFFELPFNQYLGRISYGFYLVHGPLLWTIGDRLYVAVGWIRGEHALGLTHWINIWPLPKGGPVGLDLAFLVPQLVLLPLTLWVAEIVTTLIDTPSITFSSWLYKKALAAGGGSVKL